MNLINSAGPLPWEDCAKTIDKVLLERRLQVVRRQLAMLYVFVVD